MSGRGKMKRVKAVFLDRDGVINRRLPDDYVTEWGQFSFCRGAAEGMSLLRKAGYLLIVITNQRGIGRGLMSEKDLAEIHRRMEAELEKSGAAPDAIYFCPHDHDARCDCRKPRPGMIRQACSRFEIDPERSVVIGDSESDLEAGRAAGVDGVLVVPEGETKPRGVKTANSLLEAAKMLTASRNGEG